MLATRRYNSKDKLNTFRPVTGSHRSARSFSRSSGPAHVALGDRGYGQANHKVGRTHSNLTCGMRKITVCLPMATCVSMVLHHLSGGDAGKIRASLGFGNILPIGNGRGLWSLFAGNPRE